MIFSRIRDNKGKAKFVATAFCGVCLVFGGFVLISAMINSLHSRAEELDDGVRVAENSELTYYLKVKYDGVDRQGTESSDAATAEVRSDLISVSDKIPDGLTFEGFVESPDGTYGAVERSDGVTPCAGSVVDDTGDTTGWNAGNTEYVFHGLHYDAATRTVSFGVKNLKAGCQLQVGIITRTPYLQEGERRRDFYNYAGISEGPLSNGSNTVHTYIGRDDVPVYKVLYSYTGDVPDGAPSLPSEIAYPAGTTVGLATDPRLDGYTFSGWTSNDVTITDGSFTMPADMVTLSGSFTAKPKYNVTYSITGDAPSSYRVPKQKSYGEGDTVEVDSLQPGAVVDGWVFSGWTTNDVTVTEGSFAMPADAVAFTASFDHISYTVSYAFEGTVMPTGAESLLPASASYYPGDEVTTAAAPTAAGYQFSGWYKAATFTMPEEDVVIMGEWSEVSELFRPTISMTITNPKAEGYYKGETVRFEITVTNPTDFEIMNVNVGLDSEGVEFTEHEGYTVRTEQLAQVASLAAGASAKFYAEFEVTANEDADLTNIAKLMSATAEGNNRMDTSDEAMASYSVSSAFHTNYFEQDPPFTGIIMNSLLPFIVLIALGAVGGVAILARRKREQ